MPDFLAMSDEDFLNQVEPDTEAAAQEAAQATKEPETTQTETSTTASEGTVIEDTSDDATVAAAEPTAIELAANVEDTTDPTGSTTAVTKPTATAAKAEGATSETKAGEPKAGEAATETQEVTAPVDYEAFYKQILTPFKANGKTIELKSPAEAIQLMQMGANYTRKMQELVPQRKILLMLEKSGLLDEGKLSYLIDLDRKDPNAIRKLVKDSGIDPMDIDTSVTPTYHEGNHRVTDEEATFHTALDDMKSSQSGLETLQTINTDWDQASKEALWKSPEILTIIRQQKQSGIYARITSEMDRQKTLGQLSTATPFLQAYKTVGDQLVKVNAFADLADKAITEMKTPPAVVATRVAAPKPAVTNGAKASAASSTRVAPKQVQGFINPLSMSDDEFLKQMENRV